MSSRISQLRLRVLASVAISGGVVLVVCSRPRFSGECVPDNRPLEVVFLSTTQAGPAVNGVLVVVVPDGRGGTKSQTVTVDGTSDGTTVSPHAKALLGLVNVTLSGRSEGARCVVSSASTSGRIVSLTFSRSTQQSFSTRLAEWQRVLLTQLQKEVSKRVAAEAQARAEREEAASREALSQRAQGAGATFITSIYRLGDAARARDRINFDVHERRGAQWWAAMLRRAERLQQGASKGTVYCWALRSSHGPDRQLSRRCGCCHE